MKYHSRYRVADPHPFNAVLDPSFHLNAVLDPSFHFKGIQVRILLPVCLSDANQRPYRAPI